MGLRLLLKISLRNLFRQKRRNIFLGIAIGFGMMILVIANSFSHGISDTLFNKIIIYMTGHIDLNIMENGRFRTPICRDRDRFEKIIRSQVKDIVRIEDNLNIMCRGVGNGKSDLLVIVGIDFDMKKLKEYTSFFNLKQGKFEDFYDKNLINPVFMTETKAKNLNVKLHDQIRVRLQNIYGQQQTTIVTVAGITKSQNMYMDIAIFLNKKDIKKLMGLKPQETGSLQIVLKYPKTAVKQADKLHAALTPNVAA
ncbi:MAG: hypothetical protein PHV30_07225, partial [Candidatus Margulisbacteria bacterium]|nr:hypothetical protein [Candidatus Margulisiibacteriota bacterium]